MFKYEFFETNDHFRLVVENFCSQQIILLKNAFYCRLLKKMYLMAA